MTAQWCRRRARTRRRATASEGSYSCRISRYRTFLRAARAYLRRPNRRQQVMTAAWYSSRVSRIRRWSGLEARRRPLTSRQPRPTWRAQYMHTNSYGADGRDGSRLSMREPTPLDPVFRDWDQGPRILAPGHRLRESTIPDPRSWIPDPGSDIPECGPPHPGSRTRHPRSWLWGPGIRDPGFRI